MANDHFVARTYLKRWCDRDKAQPIQAYRKETGTTFPCWPEAVCAEADGDLNPQYFQEPAVLGQFRSIFEPVMTKLGGVELRISASEMSVMPNLNLPAAHPAGPQEPSGTTVSGVHLFTFLRPLRRVRCTPDNRHAGRPLSRQ
jgi:hypothetical protein